MLICVKKNESFSEMTGPSAELLAVHEFLKVERTGAYFDPLVKAGFKSPFDYFCERSSNGLYVLNGHLQFLTSFDVRYDESVETGELSRFSSSVSCSPEQLDDFVVQVSEKMPFAPRDYQVNAFKGCFKHRKHIARCCTSSGKSMIIALVAEYFRKLGKRGILLVPNINLLGQMREDFKDYNLTELYDSTHVIGGGETDKHFDKTLTISTWQSLDQNFDKTLLDSVDYVMIDECQRFASEHTSQIIKSTKNAKFKFGFTGTIPEDPSAKMQLFGMFGVPQTYITSRELIDLGLGTPVHVNSIILNYSEVDKRQFKSVKLYPKQLQFVKEHEQRAKMLNNLTVKLRNHGNTLVLGQHVDHMKEMYQNIMKTLFPEVGEVPNKLITGKKSFEFQKKYSVYYLSGTDDAKTRESTRKILENDDDAILVSSYAILSTGVNVKKLHNLIFASPMKSFTTITQSIGRLMRKHESKKIANVYDIVDNFGLRKPSGIFYKQYLHRLQTSYYPEEFPVCERIVQLP